MAVDVKLQEGFTEDLLANAYGAMKDIVLRDLGIQADLIRVRAVNKGRAEGLRQSIDLIETLGKAATCNDPEERDLILEELLPKIDAGLKDGEG